MHRFFQVIFILAICWSTQAGAQFQTAYIGVNGLTCSQCSRTVEMKIRKLDFVADVQMNLQHTEGTITLKKDKKADMDQIAQAIVDAGFSVRYLQADLQTNNTIALNSSCFTYNGDQYAFVKEPKTLKGTVKLRFIGKAYMPKNEFKKLQPNMDNGCGALAGKLYHVAAI